MPGIIGTYLIKNRIRKCQRLKDQYSKIIRTLQKDIKDLDRVQNTLLDQLPFVPFDKD
jgi:hypothetical protein